MPNPVLDRILSSGEVIDPDGKPIRLHSAISAEEGDLLQRLVSENSVKRSIEIGCAYGISSLYICDALSSVSDSSHLIVDPYQSSIWNNVGRANLERAGFSNYEVVEEFSETFLPTLIGKEKVFDFAFIDGNHELEWVLNDFVALNRLLRVGGVLVFDDAAFKGVNRVIQWAVHRFRYRVIVGADARPVRRKRAIRDGVESLISKGLRFMPRAVGRLFDEALQESNVALRKPYRMIALEKLPKPYSEHEIPGALRVADLDIEAGGSVAGFCQKAGITEETYRAWRQRASAGSI